MRKNLRYCKILNNDVSYEIYIAINDLDEVDEILEAWALEQGITLNLPSDLVSNEHVDDVYL
jgi:hypothetical protein